MVTGHSYSAGFVPCFRKGYSRRGEANPRNREFSDAGSLVVRHVTSSEPLALVDWPCGGSFT
jgi:hypothetical protein